ncbi:unnamed protein product [Lupinus luteus]|uniref:Uncharacterized protein n=1 Tax=Lupinus luteus TaxID=3873 RepID=A0AAV1W8D1_LUPLU
MSERGRVRRVSPRRLSPSSRRAYGVSTRRTATRRSPSFPRGILSRVFRPYAKNVSLSRSRWVTNPHKVSVPRFFARNFESNLNVKEGWGELSSFYVSNLPEVLVECSFGLSSKSGEQFGMCSFLSRGISLPIDLAL